MRRSASEIINNLEMRIARLERQSNLHLNSSTENIANFITRYKDVNDNWARLDDSIQEGFENLGVIPNILVVKDTDDWRDKNEIRILVVPKGKRTRYSVIYYKDRKTVSVFKGDFLKKKLK